MALVRGSNATARYCPLAFCAWPTMNVVDAAKAVLSPPPRVPRSLWPKAPDEGPVDEGVVRAARRLRAADDHRAEVGDVIGR